MLLTPRIATTRARGGGKCRLGSHAMGNQVSKCDPTRGATIDALIEFSEARGLDQDLEASSRVT